jgi:hypothetical protein
LFAAATQGYFFARCRWWETAALLLIAFTLFRPGYWLDQVQPPFADQPGVSLVEAVGAAQPADEIRVRVSGPDFNDATKTVESSLVFNVGAQKTAEDRLKAVGLAVQKEGDVLKLEEPAFGSKFSKLGETLDFYADKPVVVSQVRTPVSGRWMKEIFYIPALLLLGLVIAVQRRRQTQPAF